MPIDELLRDMDIYINKIENGNNNGCIMMFKALNDYCKDNKEYNNEMFDLFNYWKEIVYPINRTIVFEDYLIRLIKIIENENEFKNTLIAAKIYKELIEKRFYILTQSIIFKH